MDVGLVIDLSGSLEIVYETIIRFAEELVYRLPIAFYRANVGIISYQDTAEVNAALGQYDTTRELLAALQFGSYGGKTNTAEALRLTYQELFTGGDRSGVPNKAILITDGRSNINEGGTIREAVTVKDSDIELYVVAVGDNPNMNEINDIASEPNNQFVVQVSNPTEVQHAAELIMDHLCEN